MQHQAAACIRRGDVQITNIELNQSRLMGQITAAKYQIIPRENEVFSLFVILMDQHML